jgi:peptidylamidoglycolate lyase
MKRNEFIKASSLGLLGATLPIQYMGKQEVILGHNNKRYKINTRWSQADVARYPVNNCHEMVQDKKGRILLLTDETRNMC